MAEVNTSNIFGEVFNQAGKLVPAPLPDYFNTNPDAIIPGTETPPGCKVAPKDSGDPFIATNGYAFTKNGITYRQVTDTFLKKGRFSINDAIAFLSDLEVKGACTIRNPLYDQSNLKTAANLLIGFLRRPYPAIPTNTTPMEFSVSEDSSLVASSSTTPKNSGQEKNWLASLESLAYFLDLDKLLAYHGIGDYPTLPPRLEEIIKGAELIAGTIMVGGGVVATGSAFFADLVVGAAWVLNPAATKGASLIILAGSAKILLKTAAIALAGGATAYILAKLFYSDEIKAEQEATNVAQNPYLEGKQTLAAIETTRKEVVDIKATQP